DVMFDGQVAALGIDCAAAARGVGQHDDGDDGGCAGSPVVTQHAGRDRAGTVVGVESATCFGRVVLDGRAADAAFALVKVDAAATAHVQANVEACHFQIAGCAGSLVVADDRVNDLTVALIEVDAAACLGRV